MSQSREYPNLLPRNASRYADGVAVSNGVAVTYDVPLAGSAKVMARIKTTGAGALDLTFGYYRDGTFTAYTSGNPTQVAIVGGTENAISTATYGENYCRVTFTPSADGTITYLDVSQV